MAYSASLRKTKQAVRALLPQGALNRREARYFGRYGEVEMRLVDLLCRSGEDAIDVGANFGGYVHFMQRHARRVIAFEPVPEFVHILRAKFGDNVVIEPIALSNRVGEAMLYIPVISGMKVGGCSSLSSVAAAGYEARDIIRARITRLDESYAGTVGFIKVDVEGHEQEVLEGAVETIRRCQPRLLIEIEEHLSPGGTEHVSALLGRLGYSGYYVHAGKLHDIGDFSVARLQAPDRIPDVTATLRCRTPLDDYVYNFIFFPAGEPGATLTQLRERLARL
jgi:FkbM family methyltransferase